MSEENTQPEVDGLPEMQDAMQNMSPEQLEQMQKDMKKMQEQKVEEARKKQDEQIEMLVKVLNDYIPMFKEYVPKAVRSESNVTPFMNKTINIRVAHSIMGISTELNELSKAVHLQDKGNITEELGDVTWYLAVAEDEIGFLDNVVFDFDTVKFIMAGTDESYTTDVLDMLKRSLFYNTDFVVEDTVKPYISIFLGNVINSLQLGIDLTQIIDVNLKKLFKRYPEEFDKELAVLRDLAAEREIIDDVVDSVETPVEDK